MIKTKSFFVRLIVLSVIVALSISVLPTSSLSCEETVDTSYEGSALNTSCEKTDTSGDLDGLRYIDTEEIERQGFAKRLKEKETLNSYAFLNRDGTESVVIFPENIKYVNDSGEIVEKDMTLVKTDRGYTIAAGDYGVLFPENISEGLYFEYLNRSITLTPNNASGKLTKEENCVSYADVFGENTVLRYTPLLNGIKEDIILSQYYGENSFKFNLCFEDLTVSRTKEGWVSLVNEKGESVLAFGETVAYDSAGHFVKGSLLVEKDTGSSGHLLTVTIPENFFTDPSTVYPVIVDPTIYESNEGSAIQDAPVFDGESYQDSNFGLSLVDYIGAVSPYGDARTAMRLYGLETHPIYKTLDAEDILSVKISVKGKTSESPVYVNLYRISSNVTWGEYTVTYNNVGSFDTSVNKGTYLSTTSRTEFDITSFAKGWKNLSYTNTMRVIFTTGTGSSSWFYSSHPINNSGMVDNRPYILFTYQIQNLMDEGTYYIRNRHIDSFLQPTNGSSSANAGLELNAFSGSDSQKWEVISRGNGYYTIKNVNNGYVLSVPPDSYSMYDVQLIQAQDTQADGQLWRIYMTSYCGFAIKPKSACGPNDGTAWSDRTMSVADGNDGNGALVTQRPYVYNNSFKDEWYLMPTEISETVNYEIENSQLGSYLRPEDGVPYVNNELELWEHDNSYSQKWKFTATGDGYYKISPYYNSSVAITIASGSETAENGGVIQYTYSSDNNRQKWFIYKVPHGYAIKAKSAGINNLVLSVSEGNLGNGAIVLQRAYVNDPSYKEEWHLVAPDLFIADGVYYISNGALYLEADFPRAKDHVNVDIYELCSVNAQVQYRAAQMWRIKHIGNNRYSIRPLHKLDMGLNVFGSNADIMFIGTDDEISHINDHAEWMIEKTGDKFIIKNQGNPNMTLTAEGITNTSNVSVSPYSSGNGLQLWSIVAISDVIAPKEVLFYSASSGYVISNQQRYIAPEEVRTIQDLDLTIGVIDTNNISQNGTWFVSPYYTEWLQCDSSTGTITGVKHTESGITVTCSRNVSGTMCSKSYTMHVTEIANGTYFIKSKETSRYVDIKNQNMENGTNINQWDFKGRDSQRWFFTHLGDGYYSIKSANSIVTDYYLGVLNDGTAADTQVVLRTGSLTNGMKWKVSVTTSGAYKITPKTGEPNDRVLAVAWYLLNFNGIDIKQRDYTDDNDYRDEWNLYKKCDVSLLAVKESYDRSSYFPDIVSYMENIGYDDCYNNHVTIDNGVSKEEMLARMAGSEIILIRTHGSQTSIDTSTNSISTSTISSLSSSAFNDTSLILYGSCLTGKDRDTGTNLVNATHSAGVDIVIGFEKSVWSSEVNEWCLLFFESISTGASILDACFSADSYVASHWHSLNPSFDITTDSWYIAGNSGVVFSE